MKEKILTLFILSLMVLSGAAAISSMSGANASGISVPGTTSIGNWGGVYNASLSEASIGVNGQIYAYDGLLYIFVPASNSLTVLNASTYSVIASSTSIKGGTFDQFGGVFGGNIYIYSETESLFNSNYSGIYFTFYEYNYLTLFPGATRTYSFMSVDSSEVMSSVSQVYAVYGPFILMPHVAKNPSASYIYNNYEGDYADQGPYFQGITSYNYVTGQWANSTVTTISGVSPVALTSQLNVADDLGGNLVSGLTRVTSYSAYSITSFSAYGSTSNPSVEVLLTPVTVTNESTAITSTSSNSSTIGMSFNPLSSASSTIFQSAGTNYIGLNSTYVVSQVSSPQSVLVSTNTQIMVIQSGHVSIEANPVNLVDQSGVRNWNHHLFNGQPPAVSSWHNFSIPMGLSLAASASNQYFSIFQVSIPRANGSYIPASVASTLYFTPDGNFLPAKSIGFTGISDMTFGGPNNMTLYMSGANKELYIAVFHFVPVNLEIKSNEQKAASIYMGNLTGTVSSSNPLNISVLPSQYELNITSPDGYILQSLKLEGQISLLNKTGMFNSASAHVSLNVAGDPTVMLVFGQPEQNVSFIANGFILGSRMTINVTHGSNPSAAIYHNNTLPYQDANATNYTLSYTSSSGVMSFYLLNGTYSYAASVTRGIITSGMQGSFSVAGKPLNITLTVIGGSKLTFSESGLPKGTTWSVGVGSNVEVSNSSVIVFYVMNGTYNYLVYSPSGYSSSPSSGSVTVTGPDTVMISFTAQATGGSSTTSDLFAELKTFIGDNWLAVLLLTIISILAGWMLDTFANPYNRKKSRKKGGRKNGK